MGEDNKKPQTNLKDLTNASSNNALTLAEILVPFRMTKKIMRRRDTNAGADDLAPYIALSTGIAQLLPYAVVGYIIYRCLK